MSETVEWVWGGSNLQIKPHIILSEKQDKYCIHFTDEKITNQNNNKNPHQEQKTSLLIWLKIMFPGDQTLIILSKICWKQAESFSMHCSGCFLLCMFCFQNELYESVLLRWKATVYCSLYCFNSIEMLAHKRSGIKFKFPAHECQLSIFANLI